MKVLLFPIIMLLLWALTACEGYRCAEGIVKDKLTSEPLDSVTVKVLTGSQVIVTDSTGRVDVCNRFGGCVPKCKDIIVSFSRNGYKTQQYENPEDSVFYMERN